MTEKQIIRTVAELCEKRGKRTELAKFLSKKRRAKVPLSQVSNWINLNSPNHHIPSGNILLLLMDWIAQENANVKTNA